ncbi:MAG: S1C family serine protease [Puniceicoccales bacterium]|nr:S1C family serine protease [Puniceicoccales bacterium]
MTVRKFCCLVALFFFSLVCPLQGAFALGRQKAGPMTQQGVQLGSTCVPVDGVKDIFNGKKTSIVRVVCVLKPNHGGGDESNVKQVVAGTGFFVSDRAHVLTAASVVKNVQMIWIDYMGISYAAECIGADTQTNVAVLKLLHPPSEFGVIDVAENDPRKLTEIGAFVVFVGCKLGMDPSPDLGIVCGKNISYSDNAFPTTYLRTNLMFCGGESGAPVFGLDGDLAGMMVVSLPEMAASFILPKRALSKVFNGIVSSGAVRHAKIGIEVRAEPMLDSGQEIIIAKVISESEAEKAGLRVGDRIRKVGDFEAHYKEDLHNALFFYGGGEFIDVVVDRDGKELSFHVKTECMVE